MPHDLHFLTIAKLIPLFQRREISPVDLAETFLRRIDRLDGALRPYITVTPDRARADARASEARWLSGQPLGPLDGVPIAVKDLCDTEGIRTTSGSKIRADHVLMLRGREALIRSAHQTLLHVDALVSPTMLTPAPRVEGLEDTIPRLTTRIANFLGLCAISLPCGLTSEGLPVGLQFIGKPFDEATILRMAWAYEQATDCHLRHPPGVE